MFKGRNANRVLFFMVVSTHLFLSCQEKKKTVPQENIAVIPKMNGDTIIKGNFNPSFSLTFDSNEIKTFLAAYPEFKKYENDFFLFYRNREFSYAWFDANGIIDQASAIWSHITDSSTPRKTFIIPYREKIDSVLQSDDGSNLSGALKANPTTELMITGQYIHYADVMWSGLSKSETDKLGWYIPRKKLTYADLLDQTAKGTSIEEAENMAIIGQYSKLRNAIKKYQVLEKADTMAKIAALTNPKFLRPGNSSPAINNIRKKLALLGFTTNTTSNDIYDIELSIAVNSYKKNHGFKTDSLITNEMITELNVPVKKRLQQILVNTERFRWVPASFSADEFLFVNIPEFTLHYFENKKETWSCNVVVGKTMHKTVIFSGNMKYVVMSPYWYIPTSIINAEVKPGMKRNPKYLASHKMEWNGGNVRQKPGLSNSLGLVKFLFPNSNNIYLHDSPSKGLFNEDQRAFSHGCVRVAKPRDLAIKILRQNPIWTTEKIDRAMKGGIETYVTLKKPIPVYIGYFTAFIDKDNQLNFRKDVYNRDQRLYDMIVK